MQYFITGGENKGLRKEKWRDFIGMNKLFINNLFFNFPRVLPMFP